MSAINIGFNQIGLAAIEADPDNSVISHFGWERVPGANFGAQSRPPWRETEFSPRREQ